jgi:hypothetical protein
MFGVLIIVLSADEIASPDFGLSQRQIPLVVSLRVLRALRLGADRRRRPLP